MLLEYKRHWVEPLCAVKFKNSTSNIVSVNYMYCVFATAWRFAKTKRNNESCEYTLHHCCFEVFKNLLSKKS